MPYKTSERCRTNALEYYYKNKEKVLEYQKARWKKKYAEDDDFRKKRALRDASRMRGGGLRTLVGQKCVNCDNTTDLQRHHPSYESIRYIILCRRCHNIHHRTLKYGKKDNQC